MVAMTKVSPLRPRFSACSTPVIATCRSNSGATAGEDDTVGIGEGCSRRGSIRATALGVDDVRGNGGLTGTFAGATIFFDDETRDQRPTPANAITTPAIIAIAIRARPNLAQRRPNARTDRFGCADKDWRLINPAKKNAPSLLIRIKNAFRRHHPLPPRAVFLARTSACSRRLRVRCENLGSNARQNTPPFLA